MTHFMSRNVVLFDGSSVQSATFTSASVLVADFDNVSLSWLTDTTAASRYSVEASNAEGFDAAIPDATWSNITTVLADGIYTVDPGVRWIRTLRSSLESLSISALQLRT